ncbi:MAG TPA: PQQ-binding-like beta-propeller repeat protein [Candidatus Binatus sp.]|nr:PQQ-binding-like beta-propeller repeat protein [Candidatus Binatus sp.]
MSATRTKQQMQRRHAAVVGLAFLLFGRTPAHAQLAPSAWPMAYHDLRHTGQSLFIGPQAANVKWILPIPRYTKGSFAMAPDGTLYITVGRMLCAFDPADGQLDWCHDLNGETRLNIAGVAADGTIYIGDRLNRLTGIYPDGTTRCVYTVGNDGDVRTSPAIGPDGTIYMAGTWLGIVHALNPDCSLKWRYKTTRGIAETSPAIAPDGTIYIGNGGGFLTAINPDGTLKWATKAGGSMQYCSPAIATDGTIYMSSRTGLTALNSDGTIQWSFVPPGAVIQSAPAIATDGTIYVGTRGSTHGVGAALYALDPNGNVLWSYATGTEFDGSPAIGLDGVIYTVTGKSVIAVNPDGTLLWDYPTGRQMFSSPAIGVDGSLYVASDSLYAFKP